jgi:hypothetical protein
MLFSTGWNGLYQLIDLRSDQPIQLGDIQHGHLIRGGTAPHKPSSTGFVWSANRELYAHVARCEWRLAFQVGDRVTMTDAACEANPQLMTDELNGTVIEITRAGRLYIQTDDGMTGTYNPELWEKA